jgi:hypothetical protein
MDILQKVGNKIRLLEVKSKSYDGSDRRFFIGAKGTLEPYSYLLDIAFQTYVVRKAHPDFDHHPFSRVAR